MKTFLTLRLRLLLVAAALLCISGKISAQDSKFAVWPGVKVGGMSHNGNYVFGNIGGNFEENSAYLWDWQNDQVTELFVDGELTFAMCAGNDGSVGGAYNRKAAVYLPEDGQWFELPLPNVQNMDYSGVSTMSADCNILTGFWQTPGWNTYPLKWVRTGPRQYTLDTLDYIPGPNSAFPTGNYFIRTDATSADGSVIGGMMSVDGTEWVPVIWNPTYNLFLKDSARFISAEGETRVSANGRFVTGFLYSNVATHPYRYDLQEKKMDFPVNGSDATCSDNAGNVLMYEQTGGGLERVARIWNPNTGLDMPLADYLVDMYQITEIRDDFLRSGTPMGVTGDGKTICAFGLDADWNIVSWIVRAGEEKQCLKPANFKAVAVQNEKIQLSWDTPSGEKDNIAGYNIYWEAFAESIKLNESDGLITTTSYLWTDLPRNASKQIPPGEYKFSIEAIYKNECISGKARTNTFIYLAGDCNAPKNLKGEMHTDASSSVKLSWEIPTFDLRFDNGTNNQYGMGNNGQPFFFGVRYYPEDLVNLVGTKVTHLTFFANGNADFILNIWEDYTAGQGQDGNKDSVKVVLRQIVDNVRVKDFNRVELETPFTIEAGKTYIFGGSAQGYSDQDSPVGEDQSPTAKPGQSDLFSAWQDPSIEKPLHWHSLYPLGGGFINFNWNLALTVETARANTVTPPTTGKPNPWDATLGSYTIYRDGDSIGIAMENVFIDGTFNNNISKEYTYFVKANYLYDCVSDPSENLVFNRVVSIEKEGDLSGYIYPNPVTKGVLNIALKYSSLSIADAQGRVLLQSDSHVTSLDLSQFKTGMYILKAVVDGKVKTHKIVVK